MMTMFTPQNLMKAFEQAVASPCRFAALPYDYVEKGAAAL